MVVTCIVCKDTAAKSEQPISFHLFPKDDIAKRNWLRALNLTNVANASRICSAHFDVNDFKEPLFGSRKQLKKDAVPSLNKKLQHVNETDHIRQEDEDHSSNFMRKAPLKRSNDTENYEDIPCTKYRRIGDINVDEVCTSPAEAKLCLQVALETIEEQRTKIRKLQTSNNKLRKSISDFKEPLGALKKKNFLSSEACDILKKFQNSDIPRQICENCLNRSEDICTSRKSCLESIKIYEKYAQELIQENKSSEYLSHVSNNQKCDMFDYIQNKKIKTESNFDEEVEAERYTDSRTDYYNSETENNEDVQEQMVGKFEMVELLVKREINEEIEINEDLRDNLNSSENEVSNHSEMHMLQNKKRQDGYSSSNDLNESDSLSTHSNTDSTDRRKRTDTDDKPIKCDICGHAFKYLSQLKRHSFVHTGIKPYKCEICRKTFRQPYNLIKHKRVHEIDKSYICDICHKSFRDSYNMKRHLRTHSSQISFACTICHKSFSDPSSVRRHERTHHSPEKQQKCGICHVTFTQSSDMKTHNCLVGGEKPYSCSVCQKQFALPRYLRRHQVIHNDDKSRTCEMCQVSFRNLSQMEKHKRTHRVRSERIDQELSDPLKTSEHTELQVTHAYEQD